MATINYNDIAPSKHIGEFGGSMPTLDSDDGVLVGDIVIDKNETGNNKRKIWRCFRNDPGDVYYQLKTEELEEGA